ncbi:hypothetical protein TTHERM_000666089 (macronuclear) [Tetrahymena thermophila SB210]|uniref:Uncharacterized protein n=1 Tax=Tetrahymena thermophila (strain SB210) TaxID=312017 RepID=W7X7V7_TETTS|nr:hypothetical protein TTHERM_000666089 [Tetrahymena thermophila SB210]EWS73417.1 hypothetical protein TTHERM_000666089 [Tetrahymena thermophila SB210]|eukprot:XP_012654033.1 hypothetical protein TTHERM_000666089 [Tetrahymena thermophila SB210]
MMLLKIYYLIKFNQLYISCLYKKLNFTLSLLFAPPLSITSQISLKIYSWFVIDFLNIKFTFQKEYYLSKGNILSISISQITLRNNSELEFYKLIFQKLYNYQSIFYSIRQFACIFIKSHKMNFYTFKIERERENDRSKRAPTDFYSNKQLTKQDYIQIIITKSKLKKDNRQYDLHILVFFNLLLQYQKLIKKKNFLIIF